LGKLSRALSPSATGARWQRYATLRCAAECLIATFDGISLWPALEHARDLLMTTAATAQVLIVLGQRRLLAS
jgi:hypothetical protein